MFIERKKIVIYISYKDNKWWSRKDHSTEQTRCLIVLHSWWYLIWIFGDIWCSSRRWGLGIHYGAHIILKESHIQNIKVKMSGDFMKSRCLHIKFVKKFTMINFGSNWLTFIIPFSIDPKWSTSSGNVSITSLDHILIAFEYCVIHHNHFVKTTKGCIWIDCQIINNFLI